MQIHPLHQQHGRHYQANRFVYPVLSRRSGGISIGINLNPDKVCNFDCIYCQVDRTSQAETRFVETAALLEELDSLLELARSGELFSDEPFASIPAELQQLSDIAFSGDGEPTSHRNFAEIVAACAAAKDSHGLADLPMVLITNASMFHRPHIQQGLEILAAHQGQIWAKLDAGSEQYYQLIERTPIPFQQVLDNILLAARQWPIVIQALFMEVQGQPPDADEQQAFCDRLNEVVQQGGTISLVQVYTVARPPAESYVGPLSNQAVDKLVQRVIDSTGLTARGFYGSLPGGEGSP
jgi:wyosine [tRNA(Phe)-imidazoG37] synthetase (radical SAM superfamily)